MSRDGAIIAESGSWSFGSPGVRPARAARALFVYSLLASAAIHLWVVPEHLREWPVAGGFFAILAAGQAVLALSVSRSRAELWYVAALLASCGAICLWAVSRTVGLPIGPGAGMPEPVGILDVASAICEAITIVVAVALLRGRIARGGRR
ncbi:MAG: hypothetical protein HY240_10840 [Actinobacteria bacterium]|nr:hypothetical protein [Actinomycetota bacterium]